MTHILHPHTSHDRSLLSLLSSTGYSLEVPLPDLCRQHSRHQICGYVHAFDWNALLALHPQRPNQRDYQQCRKEELRGANIWWRFWEESGDRSTLTPSLTLFALTSHLTRRKRSQRRRTWRRSYAMSIVFGRACRTASTYAQGTHTAPSRIYWHWLSRKFRQIFAWIQEQVRAKFGDDSPSRYSYGPSLITLFTRTQPLFISLPHSLSAISGFFFLRFLCPALLTPKNFGLIDGMCSLLCYYCDFYNLMLTLGSWPPFSRLSRPNFIGQDHSEYGKCCWVWQEGILSFFIRCHLLNSKEPFMHPLNEYIKSNFGPMRQFLDSLASKPTSRTATSRQSFAQHSPPSDWWNSVETFHSPFWSWDVSSPLLPQREL